MDVYVLSLESRISAVSDQISCEIGRETIILHLKDGVYYGLNEVGTTVWNLVQRSCKVHEIHSALVQQYEIEQEHCALEVREFLDKLLEAGLMEAHDAAACE